VRFIFAGNLGDAREAAEAFRATALPLLFSARSCTQASDCSWGGSKYGDCEMSEKIKSQMISRREAFF
jgi:hypothetical protein